MQEKVRLKKIFIRMMRISIPQLMALLLFCGISQAHPTRAQELLNKSLTLNLESSEIKKVLSKIEKAVDVKFVYSSNTINANQKVSLNANNEKLSDVLMQLLTPIDITYKVVGSRIVLRKDKTADIVIPGGSASIAGISALAQTVSGRVTSDTGEGLPGATVVVKGTTNGTATDSEGRYSITVPDGNAVLVFSSIGYIAEEVPVGTRTVIDVKLVADIKSLGEVVVVGYGTQRKRDITGSTVSVSSREINQVPIISADQGIQGRVSGVQVQQTSGAPGGAVQVRIRGVNSTGGVGANQPLYVIDGIPLVWNEANNSLSRGRGEGDSGGGATGGVASNGSSPLAGISPNDIESMEILKDASATAIYGSRAANGVVLITTKRGKAGRTQINFNAYYGVQSLRKRIPVINAREQQSLIYEHRRNAGSRGGEDRDVFALNPYLYNYNGTNSQDEHFRQAPMQNYNLSLSGGTEKITFATSLDYLDQQGIVLNTFAKRYSVRANVDVKASDRLKFGTSTALSYSQDNRADNDEFFTGTALTAFTYSSPIRDANGNFTGRPNTLIEGPIVHNGSGNHVANLLENERRSERYRILSNVYGELEIAKGLSFKSSFGVDYLFNELRRRDPIWTRGVNVSRQVNGIQVQTLFQSQPRTFNWVADQLLFYKHTFGIHSLDAVLGFSAQQFTDKTFAITAEGPAGNALNQVSNLINFQGGGTEVNSALVSQFVRVNYGLLDRYLLTATLRRDGSSRFGSNFRYGYFPSASFGWRVSEEPFIKNIVSIPDLKLRVSYGSTGNQNIDNFLFLPLMSSANTVWGNDVTNGTAANRFENQNIQWERTNQFDVGIDLALLNNRVTITADYYDKRTTGLLGDFPLSVISGVGDKFTTNVGIVSNKGFEFAVNGLIIDNQAIRWSVNFNIATNKNNVDSLGVPFINGAEVNRLGSNVGINRTEKGHPIGGFWVIEENGQYQSWAEAAEAPRMAIGVNQPYFAPGDFKPVDQNKDGVIDDKDRVWYGSPFPDFFGGLGSSVSYKGFTLDVVGSFQYGNLLWNQPRLTSEAFEGSVWRTSYDNRWKPWDAGTVTSVPVPRNNNPILASNRYLEDASFLRLRTITLGYDFSSNLISKLKLSRARVYIQANNFLTFTKYSGWDPEVNSFGSSVQTNGIDISAYPVAKSLMIGINLGL